jgi:hypothetical protein
MSGAGPAPMPTAQHCRELRNRTLVIEDQSEAVVDRETGLPHGVGFVAGNGGVGTKVTSSTVLRTHAFHTNCL